MSEERLHKLTLDYEGVAHEIDEAVRELAELRGNQEVVHLLGEDAMADLRKREGSVAARMDDDFRLVVAGDFKRGKSMLVNALLGTEVVPSSVTPETVTINEISYGDELKVEAVLKNRRRMTLAHEELSRERLEELVASLPGEVDHIEIKVPSELVRGVTIVDTPGLGDLMAEFDERVADYLMNADAIVFVVSALAPLSMDERDFLVSSVIPQNFSRVLVALNMADALETDEDEERVRSLTLERTREISDKIFVYPVSALDELCRVTDRRRPTPDRADRLEAEFQAFRDALEGDVLFDTSIIKAERGLALAHDVALAYERRLGLAREAVSQGVSDLEASEGRVRDHDEELMARMQEQKEHLAADIDAMRPEAKRWMGEYLSRMRVALQEAKDVPAPELQRHLQLFITDKVREGMTACVRSHARAIEVIANEYAVGLAQEVAGAVFARSDAAVADSMTTLNWTTADGVQQVIEFMGGSAFPSALYYSGMFVTGFFRERTLNKHKVDVLQPVLANFDEVNRGVLESLDKVYDELSAMACKLLEDSYRAQMEQSEEAVRNARAALEQEGVKAQDLLDTIDWALARVAGVKERLAELM